MENKQIQEYETPNTTGIVEGIKGVFGKVKESIEKGNEEQRLKLEAEDRKNLEKAKGRLAEANPLDVFTEFADIYADQQLNNILKENFGNKYTKGSSSLAQTMLGVSLADEQDKLIDEGLERLTPAQLEVLREQAKDRMNSIERFLDNEQGARQVQAYLRGSDLTDEEFENFKKEQLDEYARLEMIQQASISSLGVAMNDAGWIRRNITSKAHNVLVDVLDVTDIGDVASGIRIGAFMSAAMTGGVADLSLKTFGTVVGQESAVGAIEATVDTMRDLDYNPDTNRATSFARHWGINTALNVGARYFFAGVGKGISKGVEQLKAGKIEKIRKGLSDSMNSPNIIDDGSINLDANKLINGYIRPDVESVPLISSTEQAYDNFLGAGMGKKVTNSAGVYDGHIKIDVFENIKWANFGGKTLTLNEGKPNP